MIIAGLKLALLGMGAVIAFLLLLFFVVTVSSKLLSAWSEKEFLVMELSERKKRKKDSLNQRDEILVAVISAAIEAYRSKSGMSGGSNVIP
jgi:sodium pump decarboxylase gamma subunit